MELIFEESGALSAPALTLRLRLRGGGFKTLFVFIDVGQIPLGIYERIRVSGDPLLQFGVLLWQVVERRMRTDPQIHRECTGLFVCCSEDVEHTGIVVETCEE